jgi:cell division septation protein DedD
MRNKDTGEFELVVGDKQLLSGFFIGVLLLAVVFAMGYVLGRGTPKSANVAPETAAIPATDTHPAQIPAANPGSGTPAANPAVMNPDVAHPDATPPVEAPPQPTTVPAKEATAPAPAPVVEKPAPPVEKPTPPGAEPPANGTYWQVLAGSHNSAEALTQTLKGQGFPAITRPGHDNLTLVWVGPYTDKASLTKAKKQLEDAGFANIFKKP